ncbi:MAG: hypothetical protein M3345_06330 [Actinomycetota bacterium]|nr:hypothetical protein [Actinomycetota bacterium]
MTVAPRSEPSRRAVRVVLLAAASIAGFWLAGCSQGSDRAAPADARVEAPDRALEPGRPYPFDEPAPPREASPVDGHYGRSISIEEAGGRPVYCARCAPYRLDAGEATLVLDRGEFYVRFRPIPPRGLCALCKAPPGFASSGHYVVDGDEIALFNDPNCLTTRGIYRWRLESGRLTFEAVEDPCPFVRLRARFLTADPWIANL